MKVRAKVGTVYDGEGKFYTMNDEFEIGEERGEFLLSVGAVEKLETASPAPQKKAEAPVKRSPGRPRKSED